MQNPHVKYLKSKNVFSLFYHEHGNIFCRHYTEEMWSQPQMIAEKAAPFFSLCRHGEKAHLLYSNTDGRLFMASSADLHQWEHQSIAKDIQTNGHTKFFLLPSERAFHLIYHQPTESTGIDSLIYTVCQDGSWEKPYQIDRFQPMQRTPFLARRLSDKHIILYYRTGRNILCAREMLLEPYTIGSITPLLQTPAPFSDLSIVNDNEKIHLLYIVRGMFRTQVVYQYKHTSAISTPRILWEDSTCDNCLIYLQKNRTIAMWTVNGHPMRCISENGGASFGTAEKYTDPFPAGCIKGEFLGADEYAYNSTEWFGDLRNRYLPSAIPLLQPSAASFAGRRGILPAEIKKPRDALQNGYKQQIEDLSALLAQRSEEIAAVNANWKKRTEKLEQEIITLRQENMLLKQKNEEPEKEA